MAKSKSPTYVLTLPLKYTVSDEKALDKYFELSRKLYNVLLSEALKRYKLMKQSKIYQKAKKESDEKLKKELFRKAEEQYGFSEFSLNIFSTRLRVNEFSQIGANMTQALSKRAYEAVNKIRFGKAKRVYFVRKGELYSIEGTTNRQDIKYRDGIIHYKKLSMPIIVKENDIYAHMALQDKVKYCRILRKIIKGKTRYYIQLALQGIPPKKVDKETGEIKHYVNNGEVGLDIGTQTIAVVSNNEVKLLELAEGLDYRHKEKIRLQRKLDRQRRANNPNKYNEDGTIKKNREKWIWSSNYMKTRYKLMDIQRKIAVRREEKHNIMANWILTLGNNVKVETMNYKGLQSRSKETTKNEKTGKYNKKKRFGKSLMNKAPSKLLTIINRKLKYQGLELQKIDTYKVKASQYNPFTDEYIKKKLSERWNLFTIKNKEIKIQRDLMSAFLIKNVINKKLDKVDRNKCLNEFDEFKKFHDIEIERLKNCGNKMLSSMGI